MAATVQARAPGSTTPQSAPQSGQQGSAQTTDQAGASQMTQERFNEIHQLAMSGSTDPQMWAKLNMTPEEWRYYMSSRQQGGPDGKTQTHQVWDPVTNGGMWVPATDAQAQQAQDAGLRTVNTTGMSNDEQYDALWNARTEYEGERAMNQIPGVAAAASRTRYAPAPNPLEGAPEWIQQNQWAARHGTPMPGEASGGRGPQFQSRPQGRGVNPYEQYERQGIPDQKVNTTVAGTVAGPFVQRPKYGSSATTSVLPPTYRARPSAATTTVVSAPSAQPPLRVNTTPAATTRTVQSPMQRAGSQGVSQAQSRQAAAMRALTDLEGDDIPVPPPSPAIRNLLT